MRAIQVRRGGAFVLVALIAWGCGGEDLFQGAAGSYRGFASVRKSIAADQLMVKAEVQSSGDQQLIVHVSAEQSQDVWDFAVRALQGGKVSVDGVELSGEGKQCFAAASSGSDQTSSRLCFDGLELRLDAPRPDGSWISLTLDRYDPSKEPQFETPARYTVHQLVDLAIQRDFKDETAFNSLVIAKLNHQAAIAALFPKISANTILGVITSGTSALLHAVGDLVPFLMPTKWLKVDLTSIDARASAYGLAVMRADTANIAEGLAYGILRDVKVAELLRESFDSVAEVRTEMIAQEKAGVGLQPGSNLEVLSILNSIQSSQLALKEQLEAEYATLAQSAGFYNPQAIQELVADPEVQVAQPGPVDLQKLTGTVIGASLEVRQIDLLVEEAKVAEAGGYFNWLDPTGDSAGSLGVGLIPYIQIQRQNEAFLRQTRDNLYRTLAGRVQKAVTELSDSVTSYHLALNEQDTDENDLIRVRKNMQAATNNFQLSQLVSALQKEVQARVSVIDARYSYYVKLSAMNRLTYSGIYARLQSGQSSDPAAPISSGTRIP